MPTELTPEMRVVREVASLWPTADAERMVGLFANDATVQDMPFEHVHRGKEAIRRYLEGAFAAFKIDQTVHRMSQDGAWVLTERTDYITFGGETVEIAVMGCVEVIKGQIATWKDYYQVPERLRELNPVTVISDTPTTAAQS